MSSSATPIRIKAEGVSKSYGATRALDRANFEMRQGEVMALLGENGAGKSTFVKILGGLVERDEGRILIDGDPAELYPTGRSQIAGVAVVHQEHSSVPSLSVAENLMLGQSNASAFWRPSRLDRRAHTLLEAVGLPELDPRRLVQDLSTAQVQLVEVARVLARDAKVIVFDEPTAALSEREIVRVHEVIRRLAAEGRSIIYVTHRLTEVFEIADRVTVFRDGRSMQALPARDLDVDGVIRLMLGRDLGAMYPTSAFTHGEPVLEAIDVRVEGCASSVSLTVRRGEIIGLTGQAGSGANATVRGLAGHAGLHGGTLRINARDVPEAARRRAIRRAVAYCSSDRKRDGIFATRTVQENLSAPWLASVAWHGWLRRSLERDRARSIAGQFAIDARRTHTLAGHLSGGNQQKVALAKWMGANPRILIVEEPTRGVDVGARADIYSQLHRLCDAGMCVLIASSDSAEVLGLCDTVATFYAGKLQSCRPRSEWTESQLTREVMHSA